MSKEKLSHINNKTSELLEDIDSIRKLHQASKDLNDLTEKESETVAKGNPPSREYQKKMFTITAEIAFAVIKDYDKVYKMIVTNYPQETFAKSGNYLTREDLAVLLADVYADFKLKQQQLDV